MFGVQIEFAKEANHFKGIEGVGGKLFVTNKRIVFKSYSINIQNHEVIIGDSNIQHVEFFNTLGIFPNGLKIITSSGKQEKFVVWKRSIIKKLIERKTAGAKAE